MNKIAVLCISKEDYEETIKDKFKGFKLVFNNSFWYIEDTLIYPLYPNANIRDDTINFVESKKAQGIIDKYIHFMNEKAKRTRYIERVFNGKHEKSFVEQETEMW